MNQQLCEKIKKEALRLGFDVCGFTSAKIEDKYLEAFDQWLDAGRHGSMEYMGKIEQRRDLSRLLPGAKSVVVLAMNYYREQEEREHSFHKRPRPDSFGRIARYAYGRDYHKIIKKKLKKLEEFIKEEGGKFEKGTNVVRTKSYVDTGPVLERALAEQASIGRIGKNTCLITEKFGSWVFLSEIITTLDLNVKTSQPQAASKTTPQISRWSNPDNHPFNVCGNCTKCMDSCPTGAIIAPGIIDARLCISYLTIENKGKIPPALSKIIKKTRRMYGCDICQEVCPHNQARQKSTNHNELSIPKIAGTRLSTRAIKQIKTDQQFLKTFAGSPLMRAKRKGLKRNAEIVEKDNNFSAD